MFSDPLLDTLRRILPDFPPRPRRARRFLADRRFDAATRSMRSLATAAGANPASFTRLAQALCYAGWDDPRDALIEAQRAADPMSPFSGRARNTPDTPTPRHPDTAAPRWHRARTTFSASTPPPTLSSATFALGG